MDNLTNKIIKKAPDRMAEYHQHLINQIIKKQKFPEILKISKIIQISKKGKPKYEIDSFRPIDNLPSTEKIIEEWLKINMEKHIKYNQILNKNHHSTVTAKLSLELEAIKEKEDKKTSAIVSTDLSSAYNTISHRILELKLEHYGFRNETGKLLKSYLSNRRQFVQIQSKRSQTKRIPNASVIQGTN